MKKKTKIIIMSIFVLVFLLLVTDRFSYAKYVSNSVWNYYLESKDFYFTSDSLGLTSISNVDNNWDGESVHFNIKNSSNETLITEYDIKYKVECNVVDNPSITCTLNGSNSNTYIGTLSSSQGCVNMSDDGVIVSSMDKTTCEMSGYLWKHKEAVKDMYFDLEGIEDMASVVVNISASSTAPYSKTLYGTYQLKLDKSLVGKLSLTYDEYAQYSRVTVSNSNNQSKCAKVLWNASNLSIDINTDELLNYSSDSNGYINEITLLLDAKSNKSLKFYRLNNDTYSINTFSIMEVDC